MIGFDDAPEPPPGAISGFPPATYTKARAVPTCVIAATAYYIGSAIGFFLTPATLPIATYWPPNAILLAALLLVPVRFWWMLLACVLGAHLLVQLQSGIPLATALGWFASNSFEAL